MAHVAYKKSFRNKLLDTTLQHRLNCATSLKLEYNCLLNGLAAHKYLLVFVLLTFLFSSSALSFGNHAAEEMLQAMNQLAAVPTLPAFSAEDTHAVFAHHHGQPDGGDSKSHDSNESHHSHDTEAATTALTFAALASSPLRFFEPFCYIPEVFLDRFIPPQNHA